MSEKRVIAMVRVYALDVLARFFPRSAESREEGLSVGELGFSGLRGAILFADAAATQVD